MSAIKHSLSFYRRGLTLLLLIFVLGTIAACGRSSKPSTEPAPESESASAETSAASGSANILENPAPPIEKPDLWAQPDGPLMPDRLLLPSIEVETPVVELGWHTSETTSGYVFSEWDVAEYAAGWHKNTALPGEQGNIVMSAHNNIKGAVFRELDQLKQGDEAIIWSGNRKFTYEIERVMVVPEKYAEPEQRLANAEWIEPSDDDRLTLVSCWPRNDNTHRIIVVARPIENVPDANANS